MFIGNMSGISREQVKEELCAMIDEVMDAKNAEVFYLPFFKCYLFDMVLLSGVWWPCGHKGC